MYCPKCRSEIPDGSSFCPKCGSQIILQPTPPNVSPPKPSDKASGRSITAMILGIVGVTACGCLAPFALILGWMELNKIKKGLSSQSSKTFAVVGLVLGIIATALMVIMIPILAAIAIPNFLQAQSRSKVSRTKAELRMCAVALESYYVDNNAYPQPNYTLQGNSILPHILTTPIAYITQIPGDPFSADKKEPYWYYTGIAIIEEQERPFWILTGSGPDQKRDIDVTKYNPQYPDWHESYLILKSYDPTNGTTSLGDVFRTGP